MNRKQYILALIILIISGLFGGALMTLILAPNITFAQKIPRSAKVRAQQKIRAQQENERQRLRSHKVIRVQRLEIVDQRGNLCAILETCTENASSDRDYGSQLTLLSCNPNIHARFRVSSHGSALYMSGPDKSTCLGLNLIRKTPYIYIKNAMDKEVWRAP